jgi:hypothetical protein
MKVTYSKQHKLAAIEYINKNNPYVNDAEITVNNLIQHIVETENESLHSAATGGVFIEISTVFKDEIHLDFYVSPCFNLDDEDYEYVTEDVL